MPPPTIYYEPQENLTNAILVNNFGDDVTLKDPKRKFRFKVEFNGINAAQRGALLWYASSATKPSFAVATAEHKFLNHTFYYPVLLLGTQLVWLWLILLTQI